MKILFLTLLAWTAYLPMSFAGGGYLTPSANSTGASFTTPTITSPTVVGIITGPSIFSESVIDPDVYTDRCFIGTVNDGAFGPAEGLGCSQAGAGDWFALTANAPGNVYFAMGNGASANTGSVRMYVGLNGDFSVGGQAADTAPTLKIVGTTSVAIGLGGTPLAVISTGTYTGADTANTNLDSATAGTLFYVRTGNIVEISGSFNADPTTTLTATSFELSIPVASNFTTDEDAAGIGSNAINEVVMCSSSAANDTLVFSWNPTGITNRGHRFKCAYVIK